MNELLLAGFTGSYSRHPRTSRCGGYASQCASWSPVRVDVGYHKCTRFQRLAQSSVIISQMHLRYLYLDCVVTRAPSATLVSYRGPTKSACLLLHLTELLAALPYLQILTLPSSPAVASTDPSFGCHCTELRLNLELLASLAKSGCSDVDSIASR